MEQKKINGLERNFDRFLDSLSYRTKNVELTPALRHERRSQADVDDIAFAKIYFAKIFNEPFNDLHRHIASISKGQHTVSGSRRFGKSAFGYIVKIIKPLVLGIGGIVKLNLRTI